MQTLISDSPTGSTFPLISQDHATPMYCDPADAAVVGIALGMLADDLKGITGKRPDILENLPESAETLVIAGTLGQSAILERINLPETTRAIAGAWERFQILDLTDPLPGIPRALVIVGSDRRGTAYGVLEISRQLGVSPWIWWADVPMPNRDEVHISTMPEPAPGPAVRYRGIFLNDEQFRLKPWAAKSLDTDLEDIGPRTYEKIFQLMLRLRANYLWPAIAVTAFGFYPENYELIDRYAIVLGGHHASSLLRSKHEWWRLHGRDSKDFNYFTNPQGVRAFWRERLEQIRDLEALYTMGIRGLGDIPADAEGGLQELRRLNETVIADQRQLLAEIVDSDVEKIPQVLALWKEFEEFYGEGMAIPEDITLLRSNDSFGWLQALGAESERQRAGGLGMYYHLSYIGRPYEYLQLCSTPPAQIRHQMTAALEFGCERMWVVNVGDIKPAEYPLTYFLDLAWHGRDFGIDSAATHMRQFFQAIFGADHGAAAGELMAEYYRLGQIRRPEFAGWKRLEPSTPVADSELSLVHFHELDRRIADFEALDQSARKLEEQLPEDRRAAFYQLVGFPIGLAASLNLKHLWAQKNRHYARLGAKPAAAEAAQRAQEAFERMDDELYPRYQQVAGGKWRHFMDIHMTHDNYGPPVLEEPVDNENAAVLEVEGCEPGRAGPRPLILPEFHPLTRRSYALDLLAGDNSEPQWSARTSADWIKLSKTQGKVKVRQRLEVSLAWDEVDLDNPYGRILLRCGNKEWMISVLADVSDHWQTAGSRVFVEECGRVSIPAKAFQRGESCQGVEWVTLPQLGPHGAVITPLPFTAEPRFPDDPHRDYQDSAHVEYDVFLAAPGRVRVIVAALPTQPLSKRRGAAYAVSFDDDPPAMLDIRTHGRTEQWKINVERNLSLTSSRHLICEAGRHTLKLWMVDTNIAISGIVIETLPGAGWPAYQQPPSTLISDPL